MTATLLSKALAVTALLAAGCGAGDPSDPPARARGEAPSAAPQPRSRAAARPALCTRLRARVTGRVEAASAIELSGLAVSRTRPRLLWAHNDSGDSPRLLAFAPSGRTLAEATISDAEHVDWEDMAIGPLRGRGDGLYLGDIGDNRSVRSTIAVYRVREPRLTRGALRALGPAERLVLRYPDRAHDAEALLVDPVTGALAIVTKDFRGAAGVYIARRFRPGAVTTMRAAGRVSLGPGQAVTAGDVSASGRTIVLRSYDRAFAWARPRGWSLAAALRRRPCVVAVSLVREGQGEALALTAGGRAFYTVAEGSRPALRRYSPAR